jgi:hypothetical protein
MAIEYIYQLFSSQDPSKFTQICIFGFKTYHLATLPWRQIFLNEKVANCRALGSMLWSQFSVFLTIFGEKIGGFLKNKCYDQNFAKFSFILSQKRQFFRWIFRRNFFKIIISVPDPKTITLSEVLFVDLKFAQYFCWKVVNKNIQ